jgi:CelD/BcsL family acetyltransferase involved in cellulose biosynthesis
LRGIVPYLFHALRYERPISDPAYADESPGSILIGHAVGEAVREAATEFHFLRGGESYKYRWGAVGRWNRKQTFTRSKP